MAMSKALLKSILEDEALTRGLGDPEARMLVEWLVERAEGVVSQSPSEAEARAPVGRLCGRARVISRFVRLSSNLKDHGSACQLAACERLHWPFPTPATDPGDLMEIILNLELQAGK